MTHLRQQMIDTMLLHGLAQRTQDSYLTGVKDLARYTRQSPEHLSLKQIEQWLLYLVKERQLSPSSCRLYFNSVSFLFTRVLKRKDFARYGFILPKNRQQIPTLLNPPEVAAILSAPARARDRMMLKLCYACGLRVSELVRVGVPDIDGQQRLLRVTQGKGNKDRLIPVGATLLQHLRHHWVRHHPKVFLFRGQKPDSHLGITVPQKVFRQAKKVAGIGKSGGIHSLRHAFATHCLQQGVPIHQLQQRLGHRHLHSTLRYTHWLPQTGEGGCVVDLLGELPLEYNV
ncbi:MAG: site-specific integrase [Methylococcales bacterium]|nr:site-specific integrase [Methylococcales bacterium]